MCLDKKYCINQLCDAGYINARCIAVNTYYYLGQPMYISYI